MPACLVHQSLPYFLHGVPDRPQSYERLGAAFKEQMGLTLQMEGISELGFDMGGAPGGGPRLGPQRTACLPAGSPPAAGALTPRCCGGAPSVLQQATAHAPAHGPPASCGKNISNAGRMRNCTSSRQRLIILRAGCITGRYLPPLSHLLGSKAQADHVRDPYPEHGSEGNSRMWIACMVQVSELTLETHAHAGRALW